MNLDFRARGRKNGGQGSFALGGGSFVSCLPAGRFLDVTQFLFIVFKGLRGLAAARPGIGAFSIKGKYTIPPRLRAEYPLRDLLRACGAYALRRI